MFFSFGTYQEFFSKIAIIVELISYLFLCVGKVDETVPKMVWFSSAATHDHMLLSKLKLDPNTIYVFDKGYNDYQAFYAFTEAGTGFVTRLKDNAVYESIKQNSIDEKIHSGVEIDEIIELTVKNQW